MREITLALVRRLLVSAFLTLQLVLSSANSRSRLRSTKSSRASSRSRSVSAVTPLSLMVFNAMSTPSRWSSVPSKGCKSVSSTSGAVHPMKGAASSTHPYLTRRRSSRVACTVVVGVGVDDKLDIVRPAVGAVRHLDFLTVVVMVRLSTAEHAEPFRRRKVAAHHANVYFRRTGFGTSSRGWARVYAD